MGEAKRKKNLGIPPKEKNENSKMTQLDKKLFKKKLDLFYINIL